MQVHDKFYINGQWVAPKGTGKLEVIDPSTEEVCGVVPSGNADDVNAAVAAARVSVAVAVPVLAAVAVKVVVPQPLTVIDPSDPTPNVGNTNAMVSAAFIGTFNANVNTIEDAADVTGLLITNEVR